jgi:hypothetical protein
VFTGPSVSGEARAFSIVALVDPGVFALGSWPAEKSAISSLPMLPAAAFPALMWAVSLIAAFVAAELLVTRHIRDLRGAIMRFARGHRVATRLDMSLAPGEIRDTTEAFVQMTPALLARHSRNGGGVQPACPGRRSEEGACNGKNTEQTRRGTPPLRRQQLAARPAKWRGRTGPGRGRPAIAGARTAALAGWPPWRRRPGQLRRRGTGGPGPWRHRSGRAQTRRARLWLRLRWQ